jgi:long-chain acyl-CoA synthetase
VPVVTFSENIPSVAGVTQTSFAQFTATKIDPALEEAFRKSAESVPADSVGSIVYTSGTTGRPKGAVLLNGSFSAELRTIVEEFELRKDDVTVTFLPFAHILARVESMMPIYAGVTLGFAENVNTVADNIREIKPTLLVSVPRIYEKIYAKILSGVEASPPAKRNIFKWAIGIGREVARLRSEKLPVPLLLGLKYKIADKLVFSKIRERMGGNIRMTVSGGAPLSGELCQIFHACGIKILEGYGLTETTAAITVNRPDDFAFGTVGKPLNGVQIRIAEDGEIQVKGEVVFKEYYKNEEATREVFTPDGYFCTGDIGEFTPRGHLKITDRKKELIVTSGGKKIAPQKLENMLKTNRFISNGLVYGDKQKYLVALICLNEAEIKGWASAQSIGANSLDKLAGDTKVNELIEGVIKEMNEQLASFESIKKFKILPRDFTIEGGELTPSIKVKRKVCVEKYRDYISSMY